MAQPAREAALAEVDLLAVAGRERLVERRRRARAPSGGCRGSARRRSGSAGAAAARRARSAASASSTVSPAAARRRVLPVGDREDRAVVGERARGRHERVAVRGGAQALEPAAGDHGVGVDDHHVGRRGGLADRGSCCGRSRGSCPRHVLDAVAERRLASRRRLDLRVRGARRRRPGRVPAGVVFATTLRRQSSNSSRAP